MIIMQNNIIYIRLSQPRIQEEKLRRHWFHSRRRFQFGVECNMGRYSAIDSELRAAWTYTWFTHFFADVIIICLCIWKKNCTCETILYSDVWQMFLQQTARCMLFMFIWSMERVKMSVPFGLTIFLMRISMVWENNNKPNDSSWTKYIVVVPKVHQRLR